MDDNARLASVKRLLAKTIDQKLLMGGGDDALHMAREAYELANGTSSKSAFELWTAIAAYRLAHLQLRVAQSMEALHDVDALFLEAARADCLGAYPHLYRVSALIRLRQMAEGKSERQTAQEAIDRALGHAHDEIRKVESTRAQAIGSPTEDPGSIQTNLFNLLEFAIYATGSEYSQLEGLGVSDSASRWLDQQDDSNGYVVLDGSGCEIRMSLNLAKAELGARLNDQPNALWFEFIDPDRGPSSWNHRPEVASHERIRLLAQLLSDPRTLGDPDEDNTGSPAKLRVAVGRLREHLGDYFEVDGKYVLKTGRRMSPAAYELDTTKYPILGIAHLATLRASR